MTTITSDTRFLGLPKNKTGLFAADTIHEVKPARNHSLTVPSLSHQFRNIVSTNLLLASSEQNRLSKNEIQQYYPLNRNNRTIIKSSNNSYITSNGVRNGFRPSTIRHQKLRLTTVNTQRNNKRNENKDSSQKPTFIQSHALAKLKSEIDHINNKLKKHEEWSKSLGLQNNQDMDDTPHSALSYSNSYRISSASTTHTVNRIHQRFSTALTNVTGAATNDTSNQTIQILSDTTGLSPPTVNETDNNQQDTLDYQPSHAYQIPQQSNVGSESIFLTDPSSSSPRSSIKIRSAKNDRRYNDFKAVSCPFYVMYFTNLTIQQQRESIDKNENDRRPPTRSSITRKVPVNSRITTANAKRQSTRKHLNSPSSIYTYSTVDENNYMINSTQLPNIKRLPTIISPIENDNSHILRDVLRTSSWNHLQV